MADGVEIMGQAQWANKILALSALAEDLSCATLFAVQDGTPEMLRKLVKGPFTSWADFVMAVKAISEEDIISTITEEKQSTTLENEVKQLCPQILTQGQTSPTAPL